LYYTASGIITPVGGRPVHRLRAVGAEVCSRRAERDPELFLMTNVAAARMLTMN